MILRPFTRYLSLFAKYLKPQWRSALLMVLLLLASIGLQLLNPLILSSFIDTTLAHGVSGGLMLSALLYLSVSLLNSSVSVAATYVSEQVAWRATNGLRFDLLAHILTLDLAFQQAHTQGELIERIDGDVDELSNFFSTCLVQMLFHGALFLAMLIALTSINWLLGLSLGLYTIMVIVVVIRLRRPIAAQRIKWREVDALFFGFLGEQFSGREDICANGATDYMMRRFSQLYHHWFVTIRKAGLTGSTPWILSQAMYALGGILGLVLGAYLWSIGLASAGIVFLIFTYSKLLMQPLDQLLWQLQDLQQAEACIVRIEELLKTTSSLRDGEGVEPGEGVHALTFDKVNFAYIEGEPILHDLSFTLPAGHVLGLLGRTGSGKTTIARLLFRMNDPQSGNIRLGDVTLPQMRLADLRKRIGMITQEVQLFHASVRDNLTFFNPTIPDKQVLEALYEIGLKDWYSSLDEGLDSKLSPDGTGLSAGEAQLLAFARVLLSNPEIVILDEATSRLDPATEQLLKRAMERLFANRTGIIIAHRLATIQTVSDILIIEKGRIVEYAPRSELAANPNSQFTQLLQHDLGMVQK